MTLSQSTDTVGSSPDRLLVTKLRPTAPAPGIHDRPRLAETLSRSSRARVTLVSAPAGYGKTTAITALFDGLDRTVTNVAWLALEASDSDPAQFWAGAIAALRLGGCDITRDVDAALEVSGTNLERVVTRLVNTLAALERPVVLILDDYHHVDSPQCHRLMARFIELAPPTVSVVIATRSDPPLPLGRLRANGALAELRAADLRLTEEETGLVLHDVEGLSLSAGELAALTTRTEGWPAAVHLAGLWLAGEPDVRRAIGEFAGDNRHVVDYLSEQVLAGLDAELEDFLLRTSILGRFTASLCMAVTGIDDAAGLIDRVERANLFLIALDGRRDWYRFHHLFAGLLRAQLVRRGRDDVDALHRRASVWHTQHGTPGEAIRHATMGHDYETAAGLVALHGLPATRVGQSRTVLRWLAMFPDAEIERRPLLAFLGTATTGLADGTQAELRRWLGIALTAQPPGGSQDGPWAAPEAGLLMLQGVFWLDDVGAAVRALRRAVLLDTTEDATWRLTGSAGLSFQLLLAGDPEGADETARAVLTDPLARQRPNATVQAGIVAGLVAAEAGDVERAARELDLAIALARTCGIEDTVVAALGYSGRARLVVPGGSPATRRADATHAVELLRDRAGPSWLAYALVTLVDACTDDDDPAAAHAAIAEAEALIGRFADAATLPARLAAAKRHLRLAQRRRTTAGDELSEAELAVLRLLPSPASQRAIAAELFVSLNTVKTHTRSIYRKLGVSSRSEAVARAAELGVESVSPPRASARSGRSAARR